MIQNKSPKTNALDKALNLLSSKHRRNYKQKLHEEVRNYIIKNLGLIKRGLEFVEKELRVFGGYIDIVAKDDRSFYLIELKTCLSKYFSKDIKWKAKQLLKQKNGLQHVASLFLDKELDIKLLLVEYLRDIKKLQIKTIDDSGNITELSEVLLR